MSDEEDFDESEDGDFSASEDDWAPDKDDASSESDFEDTPNAEGLEDSLVQNSAKG